MRRLVPTALAIVFAGFAAELSNGRSDGLAARGVRGPGQDGSAAAVEEVDLQVRRLVPELAAPTRAARLAARDALLALGAEARAPLLQVEPPEGDEARRVLEYVADHLPVHPEAREVPAGKHTVGSESLVDRNPRREIELEAFRIDHVEVGCFEFQRFVDATGHRVPAGWRFGRYPYGLERYPVRGIGIADAEAYARWVGGRLPTADEWEVAAHGGTGTAFPWGQENPARLENAAGRPVPVGVELKDRSPFGCLDMAGSLSEWIHAPDGPGWRGGSYLSRVGYLRVTRAPVVVDVSLRRPAVGFRVVDRD